MIHFIHQWEPVTEERLEVAWGFGVWGEEIRGLDGDSRKGRYRFTCIARCQTCNKQNAMHRRVTSEEWAEAQLKAYGNKGETK